MIVNIVRLIKILKESMKKGWIINYKKIEGMAVNKRDSPNFSNLIKSLVISKEIYY